MDQWDSFLQFNYLINADLSNAEDDGACKTDFFIFLRVVVVLTIVVMSSLIVGPLLLDEYVEWRKKK